MNHHTVVLIVEDERVLQDIYKFVLTKNGFKVLTANNGVEGIEELKRSKPNLVILDIFMPVMDGKEFLKTIEVSNYPKTKFLVFSNLSDRETQQEMLALGAHDFVVKSSMTPDDLVRIARKMTV